jgi:hypothetical protein
MITETNQARFTKLSGCGLQEGSDATYFMEIKGLAKEKKIKMWPSSLVQIRIFTAEPQRAPRSHFFIWR